MQIHRWSLWMATVFVLGIPCTIWAETHYYDWKIDYITASANCYSKSIVAVNGQSPGPTVRVQRGDRIIAKVTNYASTNVTIHWHGVRQYESQWSDGPAYITQCPIRRGQSFTYNFTVPDQEGTLFWHAHISWVRGTVYGAIIIDPPSDRPKEIMPYSKPDGEHTLVLAEWWNEDIEEVERRAIIAGVAANISNAYLINGLQGPLFNCSSAETTEVMNVEQGNIYLIRVINNALETELWLTIANHNLTVVETDASYTKRRKVGSLLIAPGQTYGVLITTNQPVGQYYIVISPYERSSTQGVQQTPAAAILRYSGSDTSSTPLYPSYIPAINDNVLVETSQNSIRSLNSDTFPSDVPQTVDLDLYMAISLNLEPCVVTPVSQCQAVGNHSLASSLNNVTFTVPSVSILQAYYYSHGDGGEVYSADFPKDPPTPYNYTGTQLDLSSLASTMGTKVVRVPFGSSVQLVFQGTTNLQPEGHPMHLHGYEFYVVGMGSGNYNAATDPSNFNLVNPAKRNTVLTTRAGWTAIRWRANNPGAWLLHCHFDGHVTWGMEMVFIVENGKLVNETIPAPPLDLPTC